MKDALGHGSDGNVEMARRLGDGHPKSGVVPVHPNFDIALGMVRKANDVELVNISQDQRATLASMALRRSAIQTGWAFK